MKINWLLLLGAVCFLVFIVTLFIHDAFWNGFGIALGLVAIISIAASLGAAVTKRRQAR